MGKQGFGGFIKKGIGKRLEDRKFKSELKKLEKDEFRKTFRSGAKARAIKRGRERGKLASTTFRPSISTRARIKKSVVNVPRIKISEKRRRTAKRIARNLADFSQEEAFTKRRPIRKKRRSQFDLF